MAGITVVMDLHTQKKEREWFLRSFDQFKRIENYKKKGSDVPRLQDRKRG